MAEIDSRFDISDAITALGNMLRYSINWNSENVTIGNEIEHVQNYLELINIRFDYKIELKLDMPEYISNQEIPKLTVQPIVENAVTHGIEALAANSDIEIKAAETDEYFDLILSDRGKGIPPERLVVINKRLARDIGDESDTGGIGLKNVHDRIIMSFGREYGVSVASETGRGTRVSIRLPYKYVNYDAVTASGGDLV